MLLLPSNSHDLTLHQAGSGGGGGGKKGKGKKGKGAKGRTSPDPEDDEVAQVCLFTDVLKVLYVSQSFFNIETFFGLVFEQLKGRYFHFNM